MKLVRPVMVVYVILLGAICMEEETRSNIRGKKKCPVETLQAVMKISRADVTVGPATADVSLSVQSTSGESHKMSEAKAEVPPIGGSRGDKKISIEVIITILVILLIIIVLEVILRFKCRMKKRWPPWNNDEPQQVPTLSYWEEKAQEELDIGRSLNNKGLHTVVCIDISASMKHGAAWEQTEQFFTQFIQGLEEVKEIVDNELVALSVFGQEVKVVQRLTNNYIDLQQAFSSLKLGGPTPLYGGLLMAFAGVTPVSICVANGIRIASRIILITDGHPTDPLLISGSDVYDPYKKNQVIAMQAIEYISCKKIHIDCVPVGKADLSFLKIFADKADGQIFSYQDGRNVARRTVNTFHAGHILQQWKSVNKIGKSLGTEMSLEDVMDVPVAPPIASLSREDKTQVLDIAKKALRKGPIQKDDATELEKNHYEFDDPDVNLPPLGTRVRHGPDWDKGLKDGDGPGTIVGHHKTKRQVHVEWDKDGKSDFYHYGDGKYDVRIVDEPRVLHSEELIATGCHVRRGKDWKWGNQGGTSDAVGVVIKVRDDNCVLVRWPDKSKNVYRFDADGFFDLEICDPSGSTPLQQPGHSSKTLPDVVIVCKIQISIPVVQKKASKSAEEFCEFDDPDVKLPSLGTRVRRGPDWNRGEQDNNGPGTVICHHEDKRQVRVEWDKNGKCDFYHYTGKQEVKVVDESRVLRSNERIATGCRVRRGILTAFGADWKWGNQNGTTDAKGVVIRVEEAGCVWVRWPNKSRNIYRFGFEKCYDLEICNPVESQTAGVTAQPGHPSTSQLELVTADVPLCVPGQSLTGLETADENHGGVIVGFDRIKNILYRKEAVLGTGCHGTIVYRGKFDNREVAVKRLLKHNFILAQREMELFKEADRHPSVVRYFGNEEDRDFIYIALELCDGTLQDYVEDKLQNVKKIEPIKLLHQVLSGLEYLHSVNIIHRDIKPHNIMISRPIAQGELRVKISDLGYSRKLNIGKVSYSSKSGVYGTDGWAAPELFQTGQSKTFAVDIFSFGCVMYYVLTSGQHPFGTEQVSIQYRIGKGKFKLDGLPKTSDGYIAKDIIQNMLSGDPGTRPTAKAVLNHLLFWNKEEKLRFIEAASDMIGIKMVPNLETDKDKLFGLDWTKHLSQELQNDFVKGKKRHYVGSAVKDLLRLIRNKRHHYNELHEDIKKSLGSIPDEYLDYFTSRFPLLLIHTYRVMKCCANEDPFKAYYKTE